MKNEIYSAGWALQDPALNYFKNFLKFNVKRLHMAGIIYPKKIPDTIEGIAVFDFQEVLEKIPTTTPLLDCTYFDYTQASASLLREKFQYFSRRYKYPLIPISQWLNTLLRDDTESTLQWPITDVSSEDLRALQSDSIPKFLMGNFLDPESHRVAIEINKILCTAEWERMLTFDQEKTPEQSMQETMLLVHQIRTPQRFHILSAPLRFLNTLLDLHQAGRDFSIHLHHSLLSGIPKNHLDFYAQCFKERLFIEEFTLAADTNTVYLSDSAAPIIQRIKNNQPIPSAVFRMTRSLIDYHEIHVALGDKNHRISLRQPDTQFSNLIASLIT